ncbi:MAG TPA: DUF6599 family protein [Acidisarcina sp.]|nr:DUF6599 family protein [Acidisarcina sp.]
MSLSTRFRSLVLTALLLSPVCLLAKPKASPAPPQPLLPADFAGWHLSSAAISAAQPQAADPANVDVLKEYGFVRFEQGDYTRDASKLRVRVIRFEDATGAYGAYTFYRRSGMPKEDIGQGGASDNNRVLFWTGNTVVDAAFDRVTSMSAAELRELAKDLPTPAGSTNVPPPLPRYLPADALEAQTTHYALGDAGYTRSGGVLPPRLIDFTRGAEAITAHYHLKSGDGTLTLLNYPTPQLAAGQEKAIQDFLAAGNTPQSGWPEALAESRTTALSVRRSGPMVAVTSGGFSADDAHRLASQVNYTAEVTWDHPQGYISEAAKAGRLLIGIATLSGILCGGTLLLGIFLGGARALYRRLRGKPASSMEEMEFISLNLRNY